jgi:hypothetical protein
LEEKVGKGEPVAIFLTDQGFPPILPADDGRCAIVIQLEKGRLFELEKKLLERFSIVCWQRKVIFPWVVWSLLALSLLSSGWRIGDSLSFKELLDRFSRVC